MAVPEKTFVITFLFLILGAGLFGSSRVGLNGAPQDQIEVQELVPQVDHTRVANYVIDVALDVQEKMLSGRETISWTNPGTAPTQEVKLHLYMNAFRTANTRFMRGRPGMWSADEAGWIDVISMRIPGVGDLGESTTVDETVMTTRLPAPVAPGETLVLEIEFEVKLPRIFSRTGYSGNYYFISQWFPKLGVYLQDRWVCPHYHPHTEYFADFGEYRVSITVPRTFLVGATGRRVTAGTQPHTKTLVYQAHPVHDFAWTAGPNFRVETKTVQYSAAGEKHEVDVELMLQRDRQDLMGVYFEALQRALEVYGRDYGPYPYDSLTVVDPGPGRGQRSGGMEYPELITTGSSWLETYVFPGGRALESVTVHELGHQYWYGAVASNEFDEPWLDEGLTSYSEYKVMQGYGTYGQGVRFPKVLADDWVGLHPFLGGGFRFDLGEHCGLLKLGVPESAFSKWRNIYLSYPGSDPAATEAWRLRSGASYMATVYAKPVLALISLEHIVGKQTVDEILRRFYSRFRFRHPTSSDFRELASEVAGEDLEWFFSQVLDRSGVLDYAATGLASSARDGHMVSTVMCERLGEVVVPQRIKLTLADGSSIDLDWSRRRQEEAPLWQMDGFEPVEGLSGIRCRLMEGRSGRWLEIGVEASSEVISAQIDPDYGYVLDVDLANNSFRAPRESRLSSRGELSWMRIMSRWLHGISLFN